MERRARAPVMCWNSARLCGGTQFAFLYLTSEKHFRNKSIYDQITLPIILTNDALCSGSWTEKVWSSSSGMFALVGTLLQTLHLYSWKCISIVDNVLSSYVFSTWQRAFSPLIKKICNHPLYLSDVVFSVCFSGRHASSLNVSFQFGSKLKHSKVFSVSYFFKSKGSPVQLQINLIEK